MRNMAVLHSPAFSYPLPVLVRVLSNLLIFKGKILYYNKDKNTTSSTNFIDIGTAVEATTGIPIACASTPTIPRPSHLEGKANISIACI